MKFKKKLVFLVLSMFLLVPNVSLAVNNELEVAEVSNKSSNMLRSDSDQINEKVEIIPAGVSSRDFEIEQIYNHYKEVYKDYNEENGPLTFIDRTTGEEVDINDKLEENIATPRFGMAAVSARQNPYYSTAHINIYWIRPNNQIAIATGSGFYPGGVNVATAGHVVYDANYGWASWVAITFGRNSAEDFKLYAESKSYGTLQEYINSPKVGVDDIGKIKVPEPFSNYGVPARPMSYNAGNNFWGTAYGYPAESGFSSYTQYATSGAFNFDIPTSMYKSTNIFAKAGMSGGPLNYEGNVVGVLSGGNSTTDYYVPMYPAYMNFFRN